MKLKGRTAKNVHTAYVGEAKAHQRLILFAEQADKEELPQIAHLFRAVAAAEAVHSRRYFTLLESIGDTQTNLEHAFQSEITVNGIAYPEMMQEAEADGETTAATIFSQTRDVEAVHTKLYKKALDHVIAERFTEYYVCSICGYTVERKPPETCPICQAPQPRFRQVT